MAKNVINVVKLQIPAGKATPAPPVGPALGQAGINIMGFTKEFNARTADQAGMIIPVVISVREDQVRLRSLQRHRLLQFCLRKLLVYKKAPANLTRRKLLQLRKHKLRKSLKRRCKI